jgi:hypothetical protein
MKTGVIDGFSSWIFLGFSHVKHNEFISREKISRELINNLFSSDKLFYKNDKCQYTVRDLDCNRMREWGNRPQRIFFED